MAHSPIDLKRTAPVGPLPLRELASQSAGAMFEPMAVLNTVEYSCVAAGECGSAVWAGYTYDLVQVQLHLSAEHTEQEEVYPAELQLVHAADDGNLLVVGVHLMIGAASSGLEALLAATEATFLSPTSVSSGPMGTRGLNATLSADDWKSLVPSKSGWCQYAGSLTTPPCTEGVTWAVASEPLTASMEQLERAGRTLISVGRSVVSTERPVQPLNGRRVTCYSADM
uniref:carbonic anhydrase n=1 Tax=Pyropia yezoensis TaxID=2788 RepID=A0A858C8Y8_PYRYE|nr:alpha-carbonic anhydrase [Neopyropia yezoensis]